MTIIQRGKEFWQNRISDELISAGTWRSMSRWTRNVFWDIRGGSQLFTVNGIEAEFDAETENGGDIVRWTYQLEKDWLEDLLGELRSDDVFFDVGGNIGFYACFAANRLTDGHVISFEPLPPNVEQLKDNLDHNPGTATVREVALSDEANTVEFTVSDSRDVGYATGTIEPGEGTSGYQVRTERGDALVEDGDLSQPSVVKIDVEGSEPLVLDGLRETLSSPECRLLYCEIHLPKEGRPSIRDYDSTAENVKETIRSLGFEIERIDDRTGELHVKARKE
jgi:FkbM family methyltransferase